MGSVWKNIFGDSKSPDIKKIIEEGAFLVDVRSSEEYAEGHVTGSVNIPVDALPSELAQFENKENIVVFCRGGNRSSLAKAILEQNGFNNVVNGGSWTNVKQYVK